MWQNHLHDLLTAPPLNTVRTSTEAAWWHIRRKTTTIFPESARDGMPDGGGDIQVHTDDMLIRPNKMYEYVTKVLQEQKGLKLTCSAAVDAHVGVKIVYGTDEEGQHTVTLLQDQSIEKMHTAFRGLLDEREQVRRTKVEIPMCPSFKPTDMHEVDVSDKSAVAEMKRWPYRQILGHVMWICMTHPECWHASRVLARHSNHHTEYHRNGLLDCALFLIRVAKGWGIKYTGTWTNEYLVQHPEHWHRVCNKVGSGDASHNDDHATMLCTGGAGVIGNRGFITGFCHSLKWVSLSTLSSEIKVLTKLSGIVFALQQLEEELEKPDMGPMTICTDSRSCTQVTADPGRHRTNLTHVDRDAMKVCEYVRRGRVVVRWIPTDENWADIFTKPLAAEKFYQFWKQMCGYQRWEIPDGSTTAAGVRYFEFTHWDVET